MPGRAFDEHHVIEIFRSSASLPDHLVGDVDANHLTESLRPLADEPRQQTRGPARSAAEIEDALARTQVHAAKRLLRNIEVMVFHLRAFALLGPAIEFLLQTLVGRWGFLCRHGTRVSGEPEV